MTAVLDPKAKPFRAPPAAPNDLVFRLTVDEYHEMRDRGILSDQHAVELLEGWLICKMTKYPPHTVSTKLTQTALEGVLPAGWFVNVQESITTIDSEPEPDVGVIRGKPRDYIKAHPTPKNVGMLAEIADSSLDRDRGIKKRIFARTKIPIYWIVNLVDRQVEVYTDPTGPAEEPDYRECRIYSESEELPVVIDGAEVGRIAVRDILP